MGTEELPRTWGDAREGFKSMCEEGFEEELCATAEQQLFTGYPTGDVAVTIDENLCARLLAMLNSVDDKNALLARAGNKVEASDMKKELDRAVAGKTIMRL